MNKTLLIDSERLKKHHYLALLLFFFLIQKTAATTYYVNDGNIKGDIYTSAIGTDLNDGISVATPKLSIKATYEIAQDGDTIIVDTGVYPELSEKGKIMFPVAKKITFKIAGFEHPIFSKNRIRKEKGNESGVFYIVDDKPVDRETYLEQKQNGEAKKS